MSSCVWCNVFAVFGIICPLYLAQCVRCVGCNMSTMLGVMCPLC